MADIPLGVYSEDESDVTLRFAGLEHFGDSLYLYDALKNEEILIDSRNGAGGYAWALFPECFAGHPGGKPDTRLYADAGTGGSGLYGGRPAEERACVRSFR